MLTSQDYSPISMVYVPEPIRAIQRYLALKKMQSVIMNLSELYLGCITLHAGSVCTAFSSLKERTDSLAGWFVSRQILYTLTKERLMLQYKAQTFFCSFLCILVQFIGKLKKDRQHHTGLLSVKTPPPNHHQSCTIAAHSTMMTSLYAFSSQLKLWDSMNNSRNKLSELQFDQDL